MDKIMINLHNERPYNTVSALEMGVSTQTNLKTEWGKESTL